MDPPPLLARGKLGIYLGMAPGVGKTYRMLELGHRLVADGVDVVVGYAEPHGRSTVVERLEGLEVLPRWRIEHAGAVVEEMDTQAILDRAPKVALVDELAHLNAPGSARRYRWQDADVLRDAGIHVLTTLNVGHVDSVASAASTIVGATVGARLPDPVVLGADEIELVDMSPQELRRRIRAGGIFDAERMEVALRSLYTEQTLAALRVLAMRLVTACVEARIEAETTAETLPLITERVMVLVDGSPASRRAVRRGAGLAAALRGTLVAVAVETPGLRSRAPYELRDERETLDAAIELGADVVRVEADEIAAALVQVARSRRATHLLIPHREPGWFRGLTERPLADRIIERLPDLEVHVVGAAARPAP